MLLLEMHLQNHIMGINGLNGFEASHELISLHSDRVITMHSTCVENNTELFELGENEASEFLKRRVVLRNLHFPNVFT